MSTITSQTETAPPEPEVFDKSAKKGWDFFTKFLLTNVLVTIAALVVVGLLTVWS